MEGVIALDPISGVIGSSIGEVDTIKDTRRLYL
jgi:hypothetical protein